MQSSTLVRIALAATVFVALSSFRPYPRSYPVGAPSRGPAALAHSHNDYEQTQPLSYALDHRFDSVEADLYLVDGEIRVSHLGVRFAGTLEGLYLSRLQRRVEMLGSVYGDGRPFYLWLDVKAKDPAMVDVLHSLLSRYPMLTRIVPEGKKDGPVTAILTGNRTTMQSYSQRPERFALHDSWRFKDDDPVVAGPQDAWRWYALNWFAYVKWDGEDAMPEPERERLRELVRGVHAKGRRLRFWGAPETPGVWSESALAGVDLIGTDDISGLRTYLDSGAPERGHP